MNQENVLTDEELVGLAVDGDEMAEETLIRRYREFVLDRAALFSPGRRAGGYSAGGNDGAVEGHLRL